jgi:N-acetyl-anhydromuramyl-L-alanine amidase AmpD
MPWYPNAERRDITTGEFWERGQHKPLAIVDHITDGNDSLSFLQNTANDSSVHFLIGRRGQVYQFIDTDRAAWANGICDFNRLSDQSPAWLKQWCQDNSSVRACGSDTRVINRPGSVNMVTISIEHEAKISQHLGGFNGFTDSQIEASIELHKWLIATHPTLRPDRDHIIGHYQIDCIERASAPVAATARSSRSRRLSLHWVETRESTHCWTSRCGGRSISTRMRSCGRSTTRTATPTLPVQSPRHSVTTPRCMG